MESSETALEEYTVRLSGPPIAETITTRADEIDRKRLLHQSEALATLFRSWREVADEEIIEQRETLRILRESLTEEPLSDRPRFR